jgi:hypothetical protein
LHCGQVRGGGHPRPTLQSRPSCFPPPFSGSIFLLSRNIFPLPFAPLRQAKAKEKSYQYRIKYYETIFPWLEDFIEPALPDEMIAEVHPSDAEGVAMGDGAGGGRVMGGIRRRACRVERLPFAWRWGQVMAATA